MEDNSWYYTQTLKCCRTFLVREYTIKPQVDELVIHLHEQGHITYNARQDISETILTTDKMERLIGILINCKSNAKLQFESLRQKFEEDGRSDIVRKLDDILELVKISPKPDEEDLTEMVNRIKDDITNFKVSEIQRCLTKVADYMATQTVGDSESGARHNGATAAFTQDAETEEDAYTRLVQACDQGDVEKVEDIITNTPDCVNITNDNGETVLMLSCQNANVNVVEALLRCDDVDVNRRDRDGGTALMKSVVRGDIDVLSVMLDCDKLDPSVCDKEGLMYIWYMFGKEVVDYLPVLQIILKHSPDLEIETWFEVETLKYISKVNDLQKTMDWVQINKVVNCLLTKNKVDSNDLLKACLTLGNPDLVSQILQSLGTKSIEREIHDYSYEVTASINPANLKVLLNLGMIDLNRLTTSQVEALIEAVTRHNDLDLCAHLSKLIRDLQVNRALKTALFLQSVPPPILSDIFDGRKYDLNIRDRMGNSVFAILCKYSSREAVYELLTQTGIDFSACNNNGQSCIFSSLMNRDKTVPKLLLDNDSVGVTVSASDKYGATPLMYACVTDNVDMVKTLVMSYLKISDVNARDSQGYTSVMYACSQSAMFSIIIQGFLDDVKNSFVGSPKFNFPRRFTNQFQKMSLNCVPTTEIALVLLGLDNIDLTCGAAFMTLLMMACQCGNITVICRLLQTNNVEVNAIRGGLTALSIACFAGHEQIVDLLLKNNAVINNMLQFSPLICVCILGRHEILSLLLRYGTNVNFTHQFGSTPLLYACEQDNTKTAELLLDNNAHVDMPNTAGVTPLMNACHSGRINTVKLLLKYKSDVNIPNKDGVTPLLMSCANGNFKIVKLLLTEGADVNVSNKEGITADVNIIDHNGVTPLLISKSRGYNDIVALLSSHNASMNATNSKGNTPIMIACRRETELATNAAEAYLLVGVKVNHSNMKGMTALMAACRHKTTEIVNLLILNKATVHVRDNKGCTPLMWACHGSDPDIVPLLLKAGVNVNATDSQGGTALMRACRFGNSNIAKAILTAEGLESVDSVHINAVTHKNNTALHFACQVGHSEAVSLLIQHHADVTLVNADGDTALQVARNGGYSAIVAMLESYSTFVNWFTFTQHNKS